MTTEADEFYQEIADDVEDLIEEYGRTIQILSETNTGTEFDPDISYVSADAIGVFVEFSVEERRDESIAQNDKKLLMAYSHSISVRDRIQDESKKYQIINFQEIKPGNIGIIYKVQVRL